MPRSPPRSAPAATASSPTILNRRSAQLAAAFLDFAGSLYARAARVLATVEPLATVWREVPAGEDGIVPLERFGRAHLVLAGQPATLDLSWVAGYGGGLFLRFGDTTNGRETYRGGRYLLDTIEHADLGGEGEALMLDFNDAYNPSCCYDDRRVSPLAPPENTLALPVRAGERAFSREAPG